MKIGKLIAVMGLLLLGSHSFAQDLLLKVPKDAQVVVTFNNKVFFDHLNVDTLNGALTRVKFFEKLFGNKDKQQSYTLQDFGFDLNSKAYLFVKGTDSVQFIGGLIPLANRKQFESMITKTEEIQMVNNLPTLFSKDRTMRISWDDHTIYCLGGVPSDYFFGQSATKERYGLLEAYSDEVIAYDEVDSTYVGYDDEYDYDLEATDTVAAWVEEIEGVADTVAIWEEYVPTISTQEAIDTAIAGVPEINVRDFEIVDSILGQDEYSDDYYASYSSIYKHNDSIKNALVSSWVSMEFTDLISGKNAGYKAKNMKALSKNTLLSLHVDKVMTLYSSLFPADYSVLRSLGMPRYLMNGVSNYGDADHYYGIEAYDAQIDVVANKLKVTGDFSLTKDVVNEYKAIYKKGVNTKFYKYLDKDILGFITLNINTEAYLKSLPSIVEKYYAPLFPNQQEYINFCSTIFEVFVDDKAVGKVFNGDNLFVLNGITKAEVTYKDYEYDDDYNYTEVEKTKIETIPQFLWMFSSEDSRIFQQLIKIGLKENKLVDHDGIFEVVERNNKSGIKIFIQIKDGIVFLGNDYDKMKAINSNTVTTKGYAPYVAVAKNNNAAFLLNTKRIPFLLEELDVPVQKSATHVVEELKLYGDFSMTSKGVVGNKFKVESSIDFPKTKPNALLFLFSVFDRFISQY